MSKSSSKERRRCFFDITIDGESTGRIVMELYDDIAPRTCENFAILCTGQAGVGKVTGKNLHYKGTMFHRVIRGFMIQGGDFSAGNGTGGESIYGGTFEDEEFIMKHDEPFVLSMANIGPDTNGSQFFITTNPAKHLDGVHVAFGKVISGKELVTKIENLKCNDKKRPVNDVIISSCGQLIRKRKASHSDSDDSTKDKSDRRSHKRRQKKRRDHSASSDVESKRSKHKEMKEEVKIFSTVKPEDLPEEPSGGRGKFLRRRSPSPKEKGDAKERKSRRDRSRSRDRGRNRRNTNIRVLRSGHKVKGRGAIRFYADDTFGREKSSTPPHWKREEMRLISLKELNKKKEEQKSREQKFSTEFETFRRSDAKPSTREYKDLDHPKNDDIHSRISFTRSRANDEPNGAENDVAMVEELEKDGNEIVIPAMEDDDDNSDDDKSAVSMHEEFDHSEIQIEEKKSTVEYKSPKKSQPRFEVGNGSTKHADVELQSMDESPNKSMNGKDASSSKQNLKQNGKSSEIEEDELPNLQQVPKILDEKRESLPSTDVSDNDQASEVTPTKTQIDKSEANSPYSTSSASSQMSFARSDSIPPEELEAERNHRKKLQKERNISPATKHSPQRQPKANSHSRSPSRSHSRRDVRHRSRSPVDRKRPRSQSTRRNLRSRSRSVKRRKDSSEHRRRSRSRSVDRKRSQRRDERRRSRSASPARRHDRNRRRRDSRSADRDRRRRRSRSEERDRRRRRSRSAERSRRRNSRSADRGRRRDSRSAERNRTRRVSRSPNRNRRSSSGGWRPGAFHEGRMEKEIRLHGRRAALRRRNVSPIRKSRRSTSKDKKRSPSSSSLSSSSSSSSSDSSTSSKSAQSKHSKASKSPAKSKSSRSSSSSSSSSSDTVASSRSADEKKSSRNASKERVASEHNSRSRSRS